VSAGPYADAFRRYRELGWRGTLPIGLDVGDDGVSDWRPGRKKRPPAGYHRCGRAVPRRRARGPVGARRARRVQHRAPAAG
jgi:hypothetical protein